MLLIFFQIPTPMDYTTTRLQKIHRKWEQLHTFPDMMEEVIFMTRAELKDAIVFVSKQQSYQKGRL